MELLKAKDLVTEDGLAELRKQIEAESEEDCAELRKAASEQQAAILMNSQDQVDSLRLKILDLARAGIADFERSGMAEIKLNSKHLWLEARETLLKQVQDQLFEQFDAILTSDSYREVLPALIKETSVALGTKTITLQADPVTQKYLTKELLDSLKSSDGLNLTLGQNLAKGHGFTAISDDGRQTFENTLESRFERKQTELRNLAGQILFEGEA